jgi:hypothetical protein
MSWYKVGELLGRIVKMQKASFPPTSELRAASKRTPIVQNIQYFALSKCKYIIFD